jgi:SAM-dependent methyltransferase
MLHKFRILRALKGNAIRQTRILLGIKSRPKAPVLSQPLERVVERHASICRRLIDLWPAGLNLEGGTACEIGPGDCLAAAAFFVAKGARHVDLVELEPPAVNEKQRQVLSALKDLGLPVSLDVISGGPTPALNSQRVSYHKQPMEDYVADDKHTLVFSHCAMEHVEDLEAVFRSVFRALRPGGQMLHIIDLGGHGEFEDPIPPLDFQTYPDWLFEWMYPTHYRNTRRFLEDYKRAAARAGFNQVEIRPLRTADQAYVESIHKQLRPAAQKQPRGDLAVIEFTLGAVK